MYGVTFSLAARGEIKQVANGKLEASTPALLKIKMENLSKCLIENFCIEFGEVWKRERVWDLDKEID